MLVSTTQRHATSGISADLYGYLTKETAPLSPNYILNTIVRIRTVDPSSGVPFHPSAQATQGANASGIIPPISSPLNATDPWGVLNVVTVTGRVPRRLTERVATHGHVALHYRTQQPNFTNHFGES